MRLPRVLFAVVLAAGGWALAGPAALAGGWATTLLDPLPDQIEANQPYTVGFWVLQHGSHVASPPISEVGLRFTDEKATALTFKGIALPEPAHYAAAIALPQEGAWRVEGLQGWFAPYKVGTLSVPGRLAVATPPPALHFDGPGDHQAWGAIHPPNMAADAHSGATQSGAAPPGHSHDAVPAQGVNVKANQAPAPAPPRGPAFPAGMFGLLLAGSLGLLAGLGLAMAGRGVAARMRPAG
jgi:hypothetical protein